MSLIIDNILDLIDLFGEEETAQDLTQLLWRTEYLNFAAGLEVTLRGRCTFSMSGNVLW